MSGVAALSGARGSLVAAPFSTDPIGRNLGRAEVVEFAVENSSWALRSSWYGQVLLNGLHDLEWRRLDPFVADRDDPRLWEIIQRIREQYRPNGPPSGIPDVISIAEVVDVPEVVEPATGESGIVELILETEGWREFSVLDRGNDLLVDIIRLERNRW